MERRRDAVLHCKCQEGEQGDDAPAVGGGPLLWIVRVASRVEVEGVLLASLLGVGYCCFAIGPQQWLLFV